MSDVFDPNKVERLQPSCDIDSTMRVTPFMVDFLDGNYIRFADYDQLLSMYNALSTEITHLRKLSTALAGTKE